MKNNNKYINIKELLNNSSSQLSPSTLARLRSARTHALDHQRTRTSPFLTWTTLGSGTSSSFHLNKSTGLGLALLLSIILLSGISYWDSYNKENEIGDVDFAILTDDMPIHVFVD